MGETSQGGVGGRELLEKLKFSAQAFMRHLGEPSQESLVGLGGAVRLDKLAPPSPGFSP